MTELDILRALVIGTLVFSVVVAFKLKNLINLHEERRIDQNVSFSREIDHVYQRINNRFTDLQAATRNRLTRIEESLPDEEDVSTSVEAQLTRIFNLNHETKNRNPCSEVSLEPKTLKLPDPLEIDL